MKRKLIALVLALALLLSTVGIVSFAAEEEKPHLTALYVKHGLTEDITTFKWLQSIADQAGVEVEWIQYVTGDDYNAVKAGLFAFR